MAKTTNMMINDRLTPVVQTDASAQEIDDVIAKVKNMTPATIHALANMGANAYSTVLQGVLAVEPTGGTFFAADGSVLINASDSAFPGNETQYFVMADLLTTSSTRRSVLAVNFATGAVKTRIASGSAWKTSWSAELADKNFAVSKSGDTMSGKLQVSMSSSPAVNCINTGSGKATWIIASNDGTTSISNVTDEGNRAILNIRSETDLNNIVRIGARKSSTTKWYNLIHAGNVSTFVEPIQMVSYVGTGTYGASNPTSVTFEFAPKLVLLLEGSGENANKVKITHQHMSGLTTEYKTYSDTLMDRGGGSITGSAYIKKSADGKTLTWYASADAYTQFNSTSTPYSLIAFA